MKSNYKLNKTADDFLAEHGDTVHQGETLRVKCSATDLAESGVQIDGRQSAKRHGRFNMRKVHEVLESYGLDPTEEIVKAVQSGLLEEDVKAKIMLELIQYCQPKLKAVEHTGKDGEAIAVTSIVVNGVQGKGGNKG